jgi:hypothetical protein
MYKTTILKEKVARQRSRLCELDVSLSELESDDEIMGETIAKLREIGRGLDTGLMLVWDNRSVFGFDKVRETVIRTERHVGDLERFTNTAKGLLIRVI